MKKLIIIIILIMMETSMDVDYHSESEKHGEPLHHVSEEGSVCEEGWHEIPDFTIGL